MHDPDGLERLSPIPPQEIAPLDPSQREQYPHTIYEWTSVSPTEVTVFQASVAAAREAGLPVTIDYTTDSESAHQSIVIRTDAEGRRQQRTLAALMQGLTGSVERAMYCTDGNMTPTATNQSTQAVNIAKAHLGQIANSPGLLGQFSEYYGGLMWSSDQGRFVRALFVHSADFDPGHLDTDLSGNDLTSLVYELDLSIPYEERLDWHGKPPAEIFASRPELDYRRLADPTFAGTPEGQKLREAYRALCGEHQARAYSDPALPITNEGTLQARPRIPLNKFPLIESLVADQVSLSGPQRRYSLGPRDVVEVVVGSDSQHALNALVGSVSGRLPHGERYTIDGPSEFQYKQDVIGTMLRAYEQSHDDPERREPLKQALLSILNAYTTGHIALSVLHDRQQAAAEGRRDPHEITEVRRIIADILTYGVASPDAHEFVSTSTLSLSQELAVNDTESNPLAPTPDDLKVVVLDALKRLTPYSDARALQRLAVQAFQDNAVAETIGHIAELEITAYQIRRSPEALLALKSLRRFRSGLDHKPDPDSEQARQTHEAIIAPAEELTRQARGELNALLLDRLHVVADSGAIRQGNTASVELFEALVKRINLYDMTHANRPTDTYGQLVTLAQSEAITDWLRSKVCWHIAERLQYAGTSLRPALPEVILDIYQISLGPVEAIRIPGKETSIMLGSITTITDRNDAFAYATATHLLAFERYHAAFARLRKQLVEGHLLPATPQAAYEGPDAKYHEMLRNLEHTARQLDEIQNAYSEHLDREDVKYNPERYFHWITEQIIPLWQRMQMEVRPEYRPTGAVHSLHQTIEDFIRRLKPVYPPDFDYLGEGGFGDFMLACYERMVVYSDLHGNTTVWRHGIPFVSQVIAYMPPTILNELKARYSNHKAFIQYLQTHWTSYRDIPRA